MGSKKVAAAYLGQDPYVSCGNMHIVAEQFTERQILTARGDVVHGDLPDVVA